jgi:hypothetical protein
VKALVDVLTERLGNVMTALGRVEGDGKLTAQVVTDLRQEVAQALPSLREAVDALKKWKEEEDRGRETYIHLKRDVDDLKKWKADQKQEKDELTRRKWSFGPNVAAAVLTFLGNLIILAVNVWLTYFKK